MNPRAKTEWWYAPIFLAIGAFNVLLLAFSIWGLGQVGDDFTFLEILGTIWLLIFLVGSFAGSVFFIVGTFVAFFKWIGEQ